jgi:hypothetical protein
MVIDTRPTEKPLAGTTALDAEALFREARRRERKRRIRFAGVGLLLALVVATGIIWGTRGGGRVVLVSPQGFAHDAISATEASGSARFTITDRHTTMGGCIPDTNTPVTRASGTVSFADHTSAYVVSTVGCKIVNHSQTVRQIGNISYENPPFITVAQAWTKTSVVPFMDEIPQQALLTTAHSLSILQIPSNDWSRIGSEQIRNTGTTEYANTITLAQLDANIVKLFGAKAISHPGPEAPSASQIPISLYVWLDGQGRVVQVGMREPLFTAVYQDGSDSEGAFQAVTLYTESNPARTLAISRLRQQSFFEITLDFSDFGTPTTVIAPPKSQVFPYLMK